jgi:hypothetical protein
VVGHAGIRFRGDGSGLLMQVADIMKPWTSPERIIEMHGAAADQQENMLDVLPGDKIHHVMGKFNLKLFHFWAGWNAAMISIGNNPITSGKWRQLAN